MKEVSLKEVQSNVEKAIVTFSKTKGRGVLVKSHFIITAAHCIEIDPSGSMPHFDYYEQIKTITGEKIIVRPYAFDLVSDIAVFGSLDDQSAYEEWEKFESYCDRTKPPQVGLSSYERLRKSCEKSFKLWSTPPKRLEFPMIPVWIYSKQKKWVSGKAILTQKNGRFLAINSESDILLGSSGGPIIDESGKLISIVSVFGGVKGTAKEGRSPLLDMNLPVWVCNQIFDSPKRSNRTETCGGRG